MRQFYFLSLLTLGLLLLGVAAQADTYPQLDISGYKKYEYSQLNVSPFRNYSTGRTYLGYLQPTIGVGPWIERLQLRIIGKLSEQLSVSYNLEQQPEIPDKYDIKVNYGKSELTFGDFTTRVSGNEFATANKFVNGAMATSTDSWYEAALITAKIRSDFQKFTTQKGNNTRGPYSLGRGSIVEGSEQIDINGVRAVRGVDYTIDYFEGKVTFTRVLAPTDEFRYAYQFTSILDLFFPTLSQRDFFGVRGKISIDPYFFSRPAAPREEAVTGEATDRFPRYVERPSLVSPEGEITTPEVKLLIPEVKPVTGEVTATVEGISEQEKKDWEAVGVYYLSKTPLIPFSEKIILNGQVLKKDDDYSVDYDQGTATLLLPHIPTSPEALTVTYRYFLTSEEAESIQGIDSRGPYTLRRHGLVYESEKVEVDGISRMRELEYQIDYRDGKITFTNKISPTSVIYLKYRFAQTFFPPPPVLPPPAYTVSLGSTYLRESARKGAGALTATVVESKTGSAIIASNGIIRLDRYPLDRTASLTVKLNGVEISPEVDYVIPTVEAVSGQPAKVIPGTKLPFINDFYDYSDGYDTGTISMKRSVTATDEVLVIYTYKKSIVATFNGTGNGTRGPYYMTGVRDMAVGSETLKTWDTGTTVFTTLTRNSSIEYYDGDYALNYTTIPYLTFNQALPTTKSFSITYSYVPTGTVAQTSINHEVIGVDLSTKIGDNLKVDLQAANSRTDQVFVALSASKTQKGNNTRGPYSIGQTNIIENSERVFVNGYLKSKDVDYYINYATGQLTFFYLTLLPTDDLQVDYEYQSATGVERAAGLREGSAYRISGSGKFGALDLATDYKKIESKFTPLESTFLGTGAEYTETRLGYNPSPSFNLSYLIKDQKTQLQKDLEGYYLRSVDQTLTAGLNPFDLIKVDFNYRTFNQVDDPLPTLGTAEVQRHTKDTVTNTYRGSLTPRGIALGPLSITNKNDFEYTESLTDTQDKVSPSTTRRILFHTGNTARLFQNIEGGFDYQQSEPITTATQSTVEGGATVTREVETVHRVSRDTTYRLKWDLTFRPLEKLAARAQLVRHEESDVLTQKLQSTRNQTYNLDLVPISFFPINVDHNRQETLTVLVGGENPRSEKTTYNLRFTAFTLLPISWVLADDSSLQESGNRARGRSSNVSATFTPLAYLKLGTTFSDQNRGSKIYSGTLETSSTDNVITDNNYTLTYNPFSFLSLDTKYGKQRNLTDTLTSGTKSTTDINTESRSLNLNYIPFSFLTLSSGLSQTDTLTSTGTAETTNTVNLANQYRLSLKGVSLLFAGPMDISANYNFSRLMNRLRQSETPKSNLDAHLTYNLPTGGSLLYDYTWERNQGEVQLGVVKDLDTLKEMHAVSANATLPQSNPILSSIVFKLTYKTINYTDYRTDGNSFTGNLLSFEGTLNF